MTVLDMLMRRKRKVLRVGATSALVKARSNDDDLAARMAITAALVMEGHDLIGLLRECRGRTKCYCWAEDDLVEDHTLDCLRGRVDAVLAAVDGPQ